MLIPPLSTPGAPVPGVLPPGVCYLEPLMIDSDAWVAQAARDFQQGLEREQSFRVLFEHFHRPVRRFFARKGFSADECLDLAQDVFLRTYEGLEGWRGDAKVSTWIFRIAQTTYLKRLRAGATAKRTGHEVAREEIEAFDPALANTPGQLDQVIDDERRQALRRAVRSLPDKMRQCLTLRIDRGLKYREIADELEVSIDTVKAHLAQARKRLRDELADLDAAALEPRRSA